MESRRDQKKQEEIKDQEKGLFNRIREGWTNYFSENPNSTSEQIKSNATAAARTEFKGIKRKFSEFSELLPPRELAMLNRSPNVHAALMEHFRVQYEREETLRRRGEALAKQNKGKLEREKNDFELHSPYH